MFSAFKLFKVQKQNVYIIIIANGYTTKQHLEVSQSSYVIRGRKKKLRVCKCEVGGGLGAKSDETKCDGLVSGTPHETVVEGEGGLGPNPMKLSMMAWFQACHVQQQWRAMGGGGGTRWIRWWWSWDCVFANRRQEGLGAKITKPSHIGSVSGCF